MTTPDEDQNADRRDNLLRLAHRFEYYVVIVLFGAIAIVVALSTLRLGIGLYQMVTISSRLTEVHAVQQLFGMIMTVLIALEFGNSIMRHLRERETIIQAREIMLISMMAVVRKIMLVDLSQQDAMVLVWLGLATFLLAGAYWVTGNKGPVS